MGALSQFFANGTARQAEVMREIARRNQGNRAIEDARRLLGVAPDASPDEIRAAFTAKVKESHPDAGGAGGDIQLLKQARNVLLEAAKQQRLPNDNAVAMRTCPMCSGRGSVVIGFVNERCTVCGGRGEVS